MTAISSVGDTVSLSLFPVTSPSATGNQQATLNTLDSFEAGSPTSSLYISDASGLQFGVYSGTYSVTTTTTPTDGDSGTGGTTGTGGDTGGDPVDDIVGSKGG